MRIDLDFVQKPVFKRIGILGFVTLLVSCWFALLLWQTHQQQQNVLSAITQKLTAINQKQSQKLNKLNGNTAPAISPKQLRQLTDDFNVLTTPWNMLFDAIEQSNNQNVALLTIEPNVLKQQITLIGEAKNLESILQYIRVLEQQNNLSQVYLQKHSVIETSNEKPLSFTVIAKWDNAKLGATP